MFNVLTKFFGPKRNIPEETPPAIPPGRKMKNEKGGTYLTEYAFNVKWQIVEERMKNTNFILTIAFGALLICFLTLFYGYWQFASTSFNDYSNKVKELNEERYKFFEVRLTNLENFEATQSANEKK